MTLHPEPKNDVVDEGRYHTYDAQNNLHTVHYLNSRWEKGPAWRHLVANPPPSLAEYVKSCLQNEDKTKQNPWRKAHTDNEWCWFLEIEDAQTVPTENT